ncbi:TRAP transporter substrate-binding protein DctP [Halalkalibacterium halodurans]|jgi:tripartite ATP-independent transporter DctP family solute receptor|uniref:C4-dicarboxylate transport system (C4-dicarboxylate-binding protein) n=2 Tax=Halalkalibacterium halodurans TaxID=86665 RepID=Q9K7H1_HALH5|nr:TRAP transporter substrate-binding protein DctP [Halalkalibacterium halodurans]MDY7223924.1 TRAP transporter substrate-binding protein DctP [Halalkalibacterium halodurans]MDY7243145.1 TRAP transporter substrate-binding protein DctP [Halalkalibacterium halodurans]MED3647861.1 TRAP transporter substrate-binding protein DctP [Halalkalibacterium halodurans]MED4080666.1 TRAP transporter substrate-binding protein DctP [Halalkalibacterium halodurans]MED4085647.1 TRAP transporter substrate-binding 
MFFKTKPWKALAVTGALAMALTACGSEETGSANGEEEYSWQFVTEETPGQVQYEYAVEFAELLEEKTDGRVSMNVRDFGSLGSEVDQVEQLQQGILEFGIISPGFTGGLVPEGQVFSLQFFFPDDQEVTQQILNESVALNEKLAAFYEAQNIKPLAFMSEGAMQWTGNSPLRSPDDFNGFKMRTQESPLMLQTYGAYGADPQALSWSELYTSLDRSVVDGQENPIFFIQDASFHEVQDHMTISNHNTYVAMVTVNNDLYESLPEDIQAAIHETIDEMRPRGFEIQQQLNADLLDEIKNDEANPTEVYELTEEERAAFREIQEPIHQFFRDEIVGDEGREMFDLLVEEIAEYQE